MGLFFLVNFVCKLLNKLEVRKEFPCEYSYNSISRNRNKHPNYSANTACHENDNEYFKRVGLYTVRIDIWLKQKYVNHVGNKEY